MGQPGSAPPFNPTTCRSDDTCWNHDSINYLGPNGVRHTASLKAYQAPTGTPSYSPVGGAVEGAEIAFSANDFAPAGAKLPLHYEWRFQRLGCGKVFSGCLSLSGGPAYTDPELGANVSYTWGVFGTPRVQLVAYDDFGARAVTELTVPVGSVSPDVTLSPECLSGLSEPGCDLRVVPFRIPGTQLGGTAFVSGTIRDAGTAADETIAVNWGDRTPPQVGAAGPQTFLAAGATGLVDEFKRTDDGAYTFKATHAYDAPGVYYGTVTSMDWAGNSDLSTFTVVVQGPQAISFPEIGGNHSYGETVALNATGGGSGQPVSYLAQPASVCALTDDGAHVKLVGLGECTVIAQQAASLPAFTGPRQSLAASRSRRLLSRSSPTTR